MEKRKVRFENNFHGTATNVMAVLNDSELELTKSQYELVRKALCGMSGCCCGDITHIDGRMVRDIVIWVDGLPAGSIS